jgi:molybdopterin converting factor small subunit
MGTDTLTLELDPEREYTLMDVLREIDVGKLSTSGDVPQHTFRVLINNRLVYSIEKSKQTIKNGDTILLFPLLSAG